MNDINKARADAIRGAWKNEKALVRKGEGTRDWSQRQQIGMIRKGQVSGYHGHHMQSVKTHPHQAGNPKNIQFLNRSEHIDGAHRGNTQNSTDGYYNPSTKTMQSFGTNEPHAPQIKLSNPLSQSQIDSAIKREQSYKNRVSQDRAFANQWRQANGYSPMFGQSNQPKINHISTNKGIDGMKNRAVKAQTSIVGANQASQNKGIEATRQKALDTESSTSSTQAINKGIASYQSKTNGQSANVSPCSPSGASKGSTASSGQSSGNSQGR